MHPNSMKRQNISLGCNGADWVHSLWKNPAWLRGTNFCINCTSSPRFAPSFMELRNYNKCTQTLWKAPKHELGSNGVDQVLWLRKITTRLRGINLCINCTSSVCFATISCSYKTIPNAPKYYEMHQNISLGCKWGRLGAFVAKNPNVTSWHELLH